MSSAIELHPLPNQLSAEQNFNNPTASKTNLPATSTENVPPRLRQHVLQERIQLVALYWWCVYFLAGWNDGTAGPLIPRIQKVYHVGFVVVSLIFVFACVASALEITPFSPP
ncbi:hypothetical protein FB451DRAFT_1229035 [Mycena latifolia]|nr:hypothetical protein FB451DRAFT_1229035 [Mycena latifolia]